MTRHEPLPRSIRMYLESAGIAGSRLAWLLVDGRGSVKDWGGDVEVLGRRQLEVGKPATRQLVGLFGLLPASGKPTEIPHFQMEPDLIVHLHIFQAPDGDGVVMVDAAPEHETKRERQQSRRERNLASRAKGKSAKS
jgi:hypothetical protein